jgi:hypothetical protein
MATIHKKTAIVGFKPGGLIGTSFMDLFTQTYTPPPVVTQQRATDTPTTQTENTLVTIPLAPANWQRDEMRKQYALIPKRQIFTTWFMDDTPTRLGKFQTYLKQNIPRGESYGIVSKDTRVTWLLRNAILSVNSKAIIKELDYDRVKHFKWTHPTAIILNNYPMQYAESEKSTIASNFEDIGKTYEELAREAYLIDVKIYRTECAQKKKAFKQAEVVRVFSADKFLLELWENHQLVYKELKDKLDWEVSEAWLVPIIDKKGGIDEVDGFALTRRR